MVHVFIYKPAKTAMQSGKAKTKLWAISFEPTIAKNNDPLMGWTSSNNTHGQLTLRFESLDEALKFAKERHYSWTVQEEKPISSPLPKSYAANFSFYRKR